MKILKRCSVFNLFNWASPYLYTPKDKKYFLALKFHRNFDNLKTSPKSYIKCCHNEMFRIYAEFTQDSRQFMRDPGCITRGRFFFLEILIKITMQKYFWPLCWMYSRWIAYLQRCMMSTLVEFTMTSFM